ncbi:MAG: carboxylating nicotinate-nucleotide diphosphorylase [Phycisphaerales bacterium]|nr:carboxylating nicotinate-nucleotide diphosphorylase [Phycisphaerales bacterium]
MNVDVEFNREHLRALFEVARHEDLGLDGDLTSMLLPETTFMATGTWELTAREAGRFSGAAILPMLLESLAPKVKLEWIMPNADCAQVGEGDPIARFSGLVCQMLSAERTVLNFLQHMSGITTLTSRYVDAVAGTHTKIFDTRKTTPGLRDLEKYAVLCGGGHNHRVGLYDAVLIKDNHLEGIPTNRLAHRVMEMLNGIERLPSAPAFVEVECDTLAQYSELLKVVGIDVILLDNFDLDGLREAVRLRDTAGLRGKVELEASGRTTLETVREIAETGVERVAVGAITHSAPILDLGLDAV